MPAEPEVTGKSRQEIEDLLAGAKRARLLDLIHELANVEPHYSPRTVGRAREMSARTITELCRAGKIPGVHKPLVNGWRISRSGLKQWDEQTRVT